MGILENIKNTMANFENEVEHGKALMNGITDMFKTHGFDNIVESFKKNGLSETINSWIGTGANLSITADQIKNALGLEKIREIANKAGISEDKLPQILKDILPKIIDKATPEGKVEK